MKKWGIMLLALVLLLSNGLAFDVFAAPSAPNVSASKSTFTTDESVILNWSAVAGAAKYGLTVRRDPYFPDSNIVWDDYVTGTSKNIGRLPVGNYRFAMKAYGSDGSGSAVSNIYYFSVGMPPKPGTFSISANAAYTTSDNITIKWTSTSNATKYGLTVRNRSNSKDVFDQYVTGNSKNVGKLPAGDYLIYMRAYNGNVGGPDVGPVYFTVTPEKHSHTYVYYYEAVHPHKEFNKCSTCGDVQWLGTNKKLSDCMECTPKKSDAEAALADVASAASTTSSVPAAPSIYTYANEFFIGENVLIAWDRVSGAESYTVFIEGGNVPIKASASIKQITHIFSGLKEGKYNVYVVANNKNGTSKKSNVVNFTFKSTPSVEKPGYVVNTGGANLNFRDAPSMGANIIGQIPAGAMVTITADTTNNFYPVRYNGKSGYASKDYISETKPATTIMTKGPDLSSKSYTTDNPLYNAGYSGECTWYAWGRFLEVNSQRLPCVGRAYKWYDQAGSWSKGQTPKANSIIVWSDAIGSTGHVAFVESINGDTIIFSHANNGGSGQYSGTKRMGINELNTLTSISGQSLKVIGYIYPK